MTNDPRPRYAIINDTDAPQPNMVVQWVRGRGYCYLDRSKSRHDGMQGAEATDVCEFGFSYAEDIDGVVRFYKNELTPTATYRDGAPRSWQSRAESFEWRVLKLKDVARRIGEAKTGVVEI